MISMFQFDSSNCFLLSHCNTLADNRAELRELEGLQKIVDFIGNKVSQPSLAKAICAFKAE